MSGKEIDPSTISGAIEERIYTALLHHPKGMMAMDLVKICMLSQEDVRNGVNRLFKRGLIGKCKITPKSHKNKYFIMGCQDFVISTEQGARTKRGLTEQEIEDSFL